MPPFQEFSNPEQRAARFERTQDSTQFSAQAVDLLEQYKAVKKLQSVNSISNEILPVFTIEEKKNAGEKTAVAKKLAMSAAGAESESVDGVAKEKKDSTVVDKKLVDQKENEKKVAEKESPEEIAKHWHDLQQKQYAHNKQVFTEIDTNHNGRISLKEIEHALNDPSADFTKADRVQLQKRADEMLKEIFRFGPFGVTPERVNRQDITRAEYLEQNRLVF